MGNKTTKKKSRWVSILGNGIVICWCMSFFAFLLGILLLCFEYRGIGIRCCAYGLCGIWLFPMIMSPLYHKGDSPIQRRHRMVKHTFVVLACMCVLIFAVSMFGIFAIGLYNRSYYDSDYLQMGRASFALAAMLLTGTFTYVCTLLIRSGCTMGATGMPEEDMIISDGKRIIWSNPIRFLFIPPFGIGILLYRRGYADRIGSWVGILCIFFGILLAVFLFRGVLLCARLKKQGWELRADELVEKREADRYDYKSHRHKIRYNLKFKSKDNNWETTTTLEKFCDTKVGTYSWTVYLKGRKKPLFYYDIFGDATKI